MKIVLNISRFLCISRVTSDRVWRGKEGGIGGGGRGGKDLGEKQRASRKTSMKLSWRGLKLSESGKTLTLTESWTKIRRTFQKAERGGVGGGWVWRGGQRWRQRQIGDRREVKMGRREETDWQRRMLKLKQRCLCVCVRVTGCHLWAEQYLRVSHSTHISVYKYTSVRAKTDCLTLEV